MAYPPLCKPGHPQQQAEEHEQLKSPFKWPLQKSMTLVNNKLNYTENNV
ncbi:hypothetical protein ACVWZ1_002502 [Thermostichus sp. MS-CIW-25]